jgi:S1-C subfamily serine protease
MKLNQQNVMQLVYKISFLFAAAVLFSCSSTQQTATSAVKDGKYDGLTSAASEADELKEIFESIKILNCVAYYDKYNFSLNDQIQAEQISDIDLAEYGHVKSYFNDKASGTATIVTKSMSKVLLLTSAHVLNFPHTIVTYYYDSFGNKTNYVENLSVKIKQDNYIADFPQSSKIEILAIDKKRDLALIGSDVKIENIAKYKSLQCKLGNSDDLEWGNLVYIFGYPMNRKMVSRGIISLIESDKNNVFLTDAVFNKGMSGGIVLALRDGIPNFELVGIVRSTAAESNIILKPEGISDDSPDIPPGPYSGNIFVNRELEIKYGITKIVAVNSIKEFFDENKLMLRNKGYSTQYFTDNN